MSQKQFEKIMAQLRRRLDHLIAAQEGRADVKRYWREGHKVRAYTVTGHWYTRVVMRQPQRIAIKSRPEARA